MGRILKISAHNFAIQPYEDSVEQLGQKPDKLFNGSYLKGSIY